MNKPSILIYVIEPHKEILKEICAGIEEEGVPFEIIMKEGMDLDTLTFESANESILGTGICIYGSKVAFTLNSLPKGKHVFYLENPNNDASRTLGANAARAVKRMPFKEIYRNQ